MESSAADWEHIVKQLQNEDRSPAYDKKQKPKEDLNRTTAKATTWGSWLCSSTLDRWKYGKTSRVKETILLEA